MLRDEIARYTELSGNDGEHTPIGIIGAYLDGYEKGLESRENIHGEWEEVTDYKDDNVYQWHIICSVCHHRGMFESDNFCPNCGADMRPEPYKAEKHETCNGCLEPCIMYEPDMRACKHKVTEKGGE